MKSGPSYQFRDIPGPRMSTTSLSTKRASVPCEASLEPKKQSSQGVLVFLSPLIKL